MKKTALWLCLAAVIQAGFVTGCKTHRAGSISKSHAVPTNRNNNDSLSTTPGVKLSPSPVPNNRPQPIPNPAAPDPE